MKRKKCKYTGKYHTLCTEEQENPQKYVFKPENDDGMTSLKSWKKKSVKYWTTMLSNGILYPAKTSG